MKVLANDGISESGKNALLEAGIEFVEAKVSQEQLIDFINENKIDVLLVRSATKVRKDIIDACSSLKIIGRGGVGMDNIDVEYAIEKGLYVINTPNASSRSVAEMVFAHFFSLARFLHESNRLMPLEGDTHFSAMKKSFSKAHELEGKNLGVIGFGEIGKEVIKIDKWFPSSQICSDCGNNDGKKGLHIREWTCSKCNTNHDRDINASKNILTEGLRLQVLA